MTKTTSRLSINKSSRTGILCFLLLTVIPLAFSHLDNGEDRQVGEFVIDLGYSPASLKAHERSTFSFFLLDDQQKPLDYKHAWVRITKGDDIWFAGPIASEERNALLTYTFATPGAYEIAVRFFNEEGMIVQTQFQLDVKGRTGSSQLLFGIPLIVFLLVLLYFLFGRKK